MIKQHPACFLCFDITFLEKAAPSISPSTEPPTSVDERPPSSHPKNVQTSPPKTSQVPTKRRRGFGMVGDVDDTVSWLTER